MKVKSTRPKAYELNINCHNCNLFISEDFYGLTRTNIRNRLAAHRAKARQHVQKTGHDVHIDISYVTMYQSDKEKK